MERPANAPRPQPGQESVWDYPRPPRLELCRRRIRVLARGEVVADSTRAWRVLETSHPPVYYLPPEDVRTELLVPAPGSSFCEWKGRAAYHDLVVAGERHERAAWSYPDPTPAFRSLRGHLAFYLRSVEGRVDDERARGQAGGFYGGWITADVRGPFKGEPGTGGW